MRGTERQKSGRRDVAKLMARAIELHRAGVLARAEKLYRKALAIEPENVDAEHFFGVLLHERGNTEEGLRHLRSAVAQAPDYIDARNNLGNVLKESGRLEEAVEAYSAVLDRRPGHAGALNNLGAALHQLHRNAEAAEAYEKALRVLPQAPDVWANYGNVLKSSRRFDEAVEAYRKSIELRPAGGEAYSNLGRLLYRLGNRDEAAAVYRSWLDAEPGNPIARHMLAACGGGDVPQRASDDYVRSVFDGFASSFDANLERLQYRAPELVASTIRKRVEGRPVSDMVDAGCGTGLCGPLLRPLAGRLVGVDLSQAMLEKALGRGVYDELVAAELSGYLEQLNNAFDVVVSADTLVYFGDLRKLMGAAAGALRAGGWLVFTVELAAETSESGFELGAHGRYAHTPQYIEVALDEAGLVVDSIATEVLRLEAGEKVTGLVVSAWKPDSPAA
jgi:predicted TPR repeat methyltransferase